MSPTLIDLEVAWLLDQLGLPAGTPNLSIDDLWYRFLNNTAPGGVPPAGAPAYSSPYASIISRQFTTQTLSNSTTETTIFTSALITDTSINATKTILELRMDGDIDSAASSAASNLRIKANGTTIITIPYNFGSTPARTADPFSIDVFLTPSSLAAISAFSWSFYTTTANGAYTSRTIQAPSVAVNMSTGLTITATIQHGTLNAAQTTRVYKTTLARVA